MYPSPSNRLRYSPSVLQPKAIENGELPRELAERIVKDMLRLQEEGREGFENPSQLARTLGVKQPSARAWIVGRAQPSYEIAKRFSAKSGIVYPELTGGDEEAGKKWTALAELIHGDHFDAREAFTAVESAEFDRTGKTPTWGDYYQNAKRALRETGEIATEEDLQASPFGKKPRKTKK